ncbi:MAG: ferrous iron transport protein B [Prevotellaceae bacterium]|jgi:ferrous iron transport protein B|nr:ferrous iron transport protein B [Prevotellaceae bacterium]
MNLSELSNGDSTIIVKVLGHGAFRKRITEMGFVKGKKVTVVKAAPLQDPVEYEVMGYRVSLRHSEAELVEVVRPDNADTLSSEAPFEGTIDEQRLKVSETEKGRTINIALVGNPNCGKTTLFNHASGSHERVGNYGGVTVDAKEASLKHNGYLFRIMDLPGTYSITEYSPEELYVRRHITEQMPDIVVNVLDASNLERNLFLTTQLIDMNIKVVVALNMYDELEKKGVELDYTTLGAMVGIPFIPTVASKGRGIDQLFDKLIEVYEDRDPIVRHIHINYGMAIERSIKKLQVEIRKNPQITDKFSSRYLAIKLLETDKQTLSMFAPCSNYKPLQALAAHEVAAIEGMYFEKSETVVVDAKYGFIAGALKETMREPSSTATKRKVRDIDDVLTHRLLGFPIFLFFMWLMFQATFTLGGYPMEWIGYGVDALSHWAGSVLPAGALHDLAIDGIVAGVGGVIVFLPNILLLFFFISLMEDTGYMARAAFMMDKLMHKIGLHGKSFIPLVMGFGCNVPAVMATRTLENRKDRLITMFITPFMSCSARLPVYVLLVSAFFPAYQGLVLLSVYLVGIAIAVLVAIAMNKLTFAKKEAPFVMELPPYRIPTMRNTSLHTWHKGQQYLRKMGSVILIASILVWALSYFPRLDAADATGDAQLAVRQKENSYLGRMGHAMEPVLRPLGFDWKMGVSLLAGVGAKEIVVSTMSVLYQAEINEEDEEQTTSSLVEKIREQTYTQGEQAGQKVYTPAVAYGFMLFILIYFPCIAVVAAIRKESGWRWAIFSMVYTTCLAWVVALLVRLIF